MKKAILCNSLMLVVLCFSFTVMSCHDESDEPSIDYSIAESQLIKDYSTYTIGNITWSTQRGYQIGSFTATPKSQKQSQSIKAWYAISGKSATREMDSEDLGTTVPEKIKAAFEATKYSNIQLWIIEEIELEHNYNNNGIQSYYEMELQSVQNRNLEAELFFSYETGELLYSKEELDDDDDSDDDRFVINAQLRAAVEKAVSGAQIIDAEIDDNIIEVEAIVTTTDGIKEEIELEFSMSYVLISQEIETEYLYNNLPAKFTVVKLWFSVSNPPTPAPSTNQKVEITTGNQVEDDYNIGKYYYEVEIDDYYVAGKEYEVEFYLDDYHQSPNIIAVIVNDKRY